jgi:hypothetical protein
MRVYSSILITIGPHIHYPSTHSYHYRVPTTSCPLMIYALPNPLQLTAERIYGDILYLFCPDTTSYQPLTAEQQVPAERQDKMERRFISRKTVLLIVAFLLFVGGASADVIVKSSNSTGMLSDSRVAALPDTPLQDIHC